MKQRLKYLFLPVITLILEMLPFGAVCIFASSPTERIRQTFSYFDLTPFGYANFAPLLTAIITCLLLIVLMIYMIKGNARMVSLAKNLAFIGVVISLGPLIFGIEYYSLIAGLITLSLLAEGLLLHFTIR